MFMQIKKGSEMLSKEEKDQIIEKVKFENNIKKSLNYEPEPKRFTWLNSKISLLLIGALITGILVPWFQYTQKSIEWKRQNRYDSISYRLNMMRDCVKEFVYLQAIRAEGFERVQPFVVKTTLDKNDYESFKSQFIELQNKHFAQNSKVTSLIISFTSMNSNLMEAQNLNTLFEGNIRYSTLYMRNIDDYVKSKYCTTNPDQCKQTDDKKDIDELENNINEIMLSLNRSYMEIIGLMENEIRRSENENDKFRF
jgi:hypothetical protein